MQRRGPQPGRRISIHALLAESDGWETAILQPIGAFLSTLSLRRATAPGRAPGPQHKNFYPRSPCGERRRTGAYLRSRRQFLSTLSLRRATKGRPLDAAELAISIHALLAESDRPGRYVRRGPEISIHALLAESDGPVRLWKRGYKISIHALLAESDEAANKYTDTQLTFLSTLSLRRATRLPTEQPSQNENFYPRSPCGERPVVSVDYSTPGWDFYPRSPCGERPIRKCQIVSVIQFLSTLSLRRATRRGASESIGTLHFYPRSPCGERHVSEPLHRRH